MDDHLQAELERLRAENARLKRDRGRTVSLKVSEKGDVVTKPGPPDRPQRSNNPGCRVAVLNAAVESSGRVDGMPAWAQAM